MGYNVIKVDTGFGEPYYIGLTRDAFIVEYDPGMEAILRDKNRPKSLREREAEKRKKRKQSVVRKGSGFFMRKLEEGGRCHATPSRTRI